jgi:hypothetical protein
MPNYIKTLESYRCGDIFQHQDGTKYILSQVESGEFNLITLEDLSNRAIKSSNLDGSILDKINVTAFKDWSEHRTSMKLTLIGNIADFNLVRK